MNRKLCDVWQAAMANPDDTAAMDEVRLHITELLDHIQDCEACRRAAEASRDPAAVFAAMGALSHEWSAQDRATLDALDAAWSDSERDIERAMTEVVLPALPEELGRLGVLGDDVTPVKAFMATNSVNLLVYGHANPTSPLILASQGCFRGNDLVVPKESLVREIGRHARVRRDSSDRLFEWMRSVAAQIPKLFFQFVVTGASSSVIKLDLDRPTLTHDLTIRWQRAAVPGLEEQSLPSSLRPTSKHSVPVESVKPVSGKFLWSAEEGRKFAQAKRVAKAKSKRAAAMAAAREAAKNRARPAGG